MLDPLSDKLQKIVEAGVRPQRLRDLLHGTWLGHPLHPVLVQLPAGAFLSASVLDFVPGGRRSAGTLVAVGLAGSGPAIAAGLTDWASLSKDQRRVGLVHAAANTVGLGFYVASLMARLSGRPARGKVLALTGLSIMGGGAYLGGHLAYAQGAGMNQAAPDVQRVPPEWTSVGSLASLPDGKPTVRKIDDVPVLVYRLGNRVTAMVERCSHQTGPLSEGEVVGTGADACVVCPWHGSTFRLVDGAVVRGPAANSQPLLRSRVVNGQVEVAQP